MPAKTQQHKPKVKELSGTKYEKQAQLYGGAWMASCPCGWEEVRSSQERAERSVAQHLAEQGAA